MNAIATTTRQVLAKGDEITLVLRDWQRVDFSFIFLSISWLCGPDEPPHTQQLLSFGTQVVDPIEPTYSFFPVLF